MSLPAFDHDFAIALARITHEGAREIMDIYAGAFDVEVKDDNTPVTLADQRGEDIILAGLARLWPDLPVISEEAACDGYIPEIGARFLLVDPLDGTREFISRNGEFTVNIGAVENGHAVAGAVYAPARGRMFFASPEKGAFELTIEPDAAFEAGGARALKVRRTPDEGLSVAASRSHGNPKLDAFLKDYKVARMVRAGSSLKFCLIAAGEADFYPRLGRTMEWDTCAGHAVVTGAGGSVVTLDGAELLYGKRARGFDNPHFLVRGWTG